MDIAAVSEIERKKFFEMMQRIHANKELRRSIVADIRKMATDRAWCAKRATELRMRAES